MWAAIAVVFASACLAQKTTIDPSVLEEIFGTTSTTSKSVVTPTPTPPTQTPTPTPFVRPETTKPLIVDKGSESCTCVPYYLCDADLVATFKNNVSVTGWGELDIRDPAHCDMCNGSAWGQSEFTRAQFGSECQESVERCCKNPRDPTDVPIPVTPETPRGCGYSNPGGLDFTITGGNGDEAMFGEYPWVVVLLDGNKYVGVGVLIHPQVVMTAAHKAVNFTKPGYGQLIARAGEWDTQTAKERLKHEDRIVGEILIHPDFRPTPLYNDIALLRLAEPVQLAAHINVICLPEQEELFDNSQKCVANGWGKDVFGSRGSFAVILKRVEQDMVNHGRCNTLLKRTRLGNNFKLHETFVCAGGQEGKDTCQGDGGAPLACPIGNNRYKLTGLVAWGISCGQRDVPAVYVAVSKFRRWIDNSLTQWGLDTSGYNA